MSNLLIFVFPNGELFVHSKFPPDTWSKKIEHKAVVSQPFNTLENGEVFYIKVDPKDNQHIIVEYWKPYINRDEFNSIKSLDVITFFFNNFMKFYYKVNDREYIRYQMLPPNFDSKLLEIDKTFTVLYKRSDPYIAYLLLE